MNRRQFIVRGAVLGAGVAAWPAVATAQAAAPMGSPLIYLSPYKSNGQLSRCQAEIWFVHDGPDFVVVTASDAWRARAVRKGLNKTQVWIGDVGQWRRSDGRYKSLPAMTTNGSVVDDAAVHARLLDVFGKKYPGEWDTYEPRFSKGLADGSRVMLRYTPATG
jgi:hypothetical protein